MSAAIVSSLSMLPFFLMFRIFFTFQGELRSLRRGEVMFEHVLFFCFGCLVCMCAIPSPFPFQAHSYSQPIPIPSPFPAHSYSQPIHIPSQFPFPFLFPAHSQSIPIPSQFLFPSPFPAHSYYFR